MESRLIEQLNDPDFDIRLAAVLALGERGDPAAIDPLETLRKSGDIPSGGGPVIERQIARLKNPGGEQDSEPAVWRAVTCSHAAIRPGSQQASGNQQIVERLDKIDQNLAEMNERLKKIEQQQPRSDSASSFREESIPPAECEGRGDYSRWVRSRRHLLVGEKSCRNRFERRSRADQVQPRVIFRALRRRPRPRLPGSSRLSHLFPRSRQRLLFRRSFPRNRARMQNCGRRCHCREPANSLRRPQ